MIPLQSVIYRKGAREDQTLQTWLSGQLHQEAVISHTPANYWPIPCRIAGGRNPKTGDRHMHSEVEVIREGTVFMIQY